MWTLDCFIRSENRDPPGHDDNDLLLVFDLLQHLRKKREEQEYSHTSVLEAPGLLCFSACQTVSGPWTSLFALVANKSTSAVEPFYSRKKTFTTVTALPIYLYRVLLRYSAKRSWEIFFSPVEQNATAFLSSSLGKPSYSYCLFSQFTICIIKGG